MTKPFIPTEQSLRDLDVLTVLLQKPTGNAGKDASNAQCIKSHKDAVQNGTFIGAFITDFPQVQEVRKQLGQII